MYKILIKSRTQAIGYSYHKNIDDCIIISINDDKPAKFDQTNSKIKAVCSVFFHDIEVATENGVLMSKQDAEKIKKYIDAYKNKINTILVHCYAGISRSSAIASAISMYLNGDDMDIWCQGQYSPNSHCYLMQLREFGIELTREQLKEKQQANIHAFEMSERYEVVSNMIKED